MAFMSRSILLLVILWTVSTPSFGADSNWGLLVTKIIESGSVTRYENGEVRSLSVVTPPDLSQPHRAEYISTLGVEGTDQVYQVQSVSAVDEEWRLLASGDWSIEQWIFYLQIDGRLHRVLHQTIHRTPDGMIIGIVNHPEDFQSPAVQSRWSLILDSWFTRVAALRVCGICK